MGVEALCIGPLQHCNITSKRDTHTSSPSPSQGGKRVVIWSAYLCVWLLAQLQKCWPDVLHILYTRKRGHHISTVEYRCGICFHLISGPQANDLQSQR